MPKDGNNASERLGSFPKQETRRRNHRAIAQKGKHDKIAFGQLPKSCNKAKKGWGRRPKVKTWRNGFRATVQSIAIYIFFINQIYTK